MGVHDGHRERMRERFFRFGLSNFNEIEALEFLLFYAIPRRDTNPLAHALLDQFGSLSQVLNATEQELCAVPGISESTAALIKLVPQLERLSEVERGKRLAEIKGTRDAAAFLIPYFRGAQDEMLLLVCLDSARRVISAEVINTGLPNSVLFDIRKLVETALKRKATSVMIAHNHPDGQVLPSKEDDSTTISIMKALRTVNIELYDHIVVAGENYVSYRRSGALELCYLG